MQRTLVRLFRVLPLVLCYGFMALAIPFYVLFDSRGRRASYRFYRQRMGYGRLHSAVSVFRNMYQMGTVVVDRFAAYGGKRFEMVSADISAFDTLAEKPEGFMMLGSHVGNFEMVGYMLPSKRPIKVLVYAGESATVMENRNRMFGKTNIEMVPVKKDLSHLFIMNNALADGEIISLPADRPFGSLKTLRLPFLGADAAFPAGPFTLAVQREAPTLAVFVMREKRKLYRIVIERLPVPETGTSAQKVEAMAKSYVAVLEKVVRQWPLQWYNFYDFWA